jgi:hypothetical protein
MTCMRYASAATFGNDSTYLIGAPLGFLAEVLVLLPAPSAAQPAHSRQPAPLRARGSARVAIQSPSRALSRTTRWSPIIAANTIQGLVLIFWSSPNLTFAGTAPDSPPWSACPLPAPRRVCIRRGLAASNSRRIDGRSAAGRCTKPHRCASVARGRHHVKI